MPRRNLKYRSWAVRQTAPSPISALGADNESSRTTAGLAPSTKDATIAEVVIQGQRSEVTKPAEKRAAGRKEGQILSAARTQFLQHGFSETSMDAIARSAAVSKATLYAYFPSKEALFAHLVQKECRAKAIRYTSPDLCIGLAPALRALGRECMTHCLRKDSAAFFQVVCSERWRFPELCRLFFENSQKAALAFVVTVLEEAKAKGLLTFSDANVVAAQLLHLIFADMPIRVALGLEPPREAEVEATLDAGIAFFLKAYGTETSFANR